MLDKINDIQIGNTYTIAMFNGFGSPYHLHVIIKKIIVEPFKEYAITYLISYTKVDTGFNAKIRINPNTQFIIWEGIVTPNTDVAACIYMKDSSQGHVKVLKKWRDYDPRYLIRAKLSVKEHPLIENIHKVNQKEQLRDFCTVIS